MPPSGDSDTARQGSASAIKRTQRFQSADLFRGNRRLIIEHQGEEYCLQLTRNERLILTKL